MSTSQRRNRLRDVPQSRSPAGRALRTRPADWSSRSAAGKSHAVRWKRNLGASETSPTVVGSRVYIGTAEGNVYCLRASDGKTLWSYRVGGAVKGAITYDRGKVFFGAYDGKLYALTAATGKLALDGGLVRPLLLDAGRRLLPRLRRLDRPQRLRLRRTHGQPRLVSRDGLVRLRLARCLGGPRVFIGSYDHVFYALNAATGNVDWTFTAAGPISGSAAVVGGLVYFSHLGGPGERHTYGLDARTGREIWSWKDGAYASVVTDGRSSTSSGWGQDLRLQPAPPAHRHR